MRCGSCGQDNREGRKFCGGCGGRLVPPCPACGTVNDPDDRFCGECGAPVAAAGVRGAAHSASDTTRPQAGVAGAQRGPASPGLAGDERSSRSAERSSRTVVSIIFADLVGSTSLHERLDAEAVRQFMEAYYAAMRGAVEAHGGRVTQVMGDGVKAVFGAPRVAEDDAIRAVRAGVAMQEAFRALAEEQRGRVGATGLRVAVNTGEVVSDGETEIIGDPVNVAARLQERGQDGDVVIGGSTQRIVGSLVTLDLLGTFALKGRTEEVEAYRVVSLDPPAGATTAAFVGRDEEIARLTAVYETAIEKPAAALSVLLGSPGLGKSRLIDEFVGRRGDEAIVFEAHCDASGGATFAPLVAALRERLGIEDAAATDDVKARVEDVVSGEDAERVRIVSGVSALLSGTPASPEETFFVIRRLLASLAEQKPVVLVIDDLQWAEPLLLDLVEHLVQWGSGVPLLVLVGARPELRELRSSLTFPGGFVADVVTLSGLDAGAAMRLAAGVIGASDLPAALAGKLLATSEGNPLFVAELVKMLVQEGVLERVGERWVASAALASLEMPPTIHALLAARIERLSPDERAVLECAAVVGRHFSRSAVAALLPETGELDARLEALRRSELIERDTGWFLGEPVLRFHHVLIRDAAYRRLLKETRATLHARLADWIESRAGGDSAQDETIGRHLERAHQHRRELGHLDAASAALGERAAHRLAAAGRRALEQDDVALASNLLGRALACLPEDAAERADLVLDCCEALLSAGDVGPAAGAIDALDRLCGDSERLRAWHTCFAGQLTTLTAPDQLRSAADSVASAAKVLAEQGDAAGEAKAHFVHAQTLARLGRVGACEAALDLALAAARRVDDRRRANAVLAGAPRAALWGPSPVTRASGRCLDVVRVLRITQGAPAVEAVALSCQGVLEALRGRTDAAKRMIASARKMVEELGIAHRVHETDVFAGRVALLEGDASAAERSLRSAYDGLRLLGHGIDAAQAAALLARALLAQGRAAEAETLSQESESLAGDDLQAAIAWRGARAEALAQRGEHEAAVELARAAVEIAAATDALLDHADARMSLAAALRAAGQPDAAQAEERRARELWETKGATLLLEGAAPAPDAPREADPLGAPRAARRVRRNRAFATAARLDGAVASGDRARLEAPIHPECIEIHHPTGSRYGRDEAIGSAERLSRSRDLVYRTDPLATLGERLLLGRRRYRASGTDGARYDVGAYTAEFPIVTEVDEAGLIRRNEVFAADRLGDAIACLYERHAALLPEGAATERAAGTARSVAVFEAAVDPDRVASALAPDLVVEDRRGVGTESLHGAGALLRSLGALMELSEGFGCRLDDVLALSDGALLVHMTSFGRSRESGGAYERPILELWAFDADGRIERWERFDPGHESEALARFDELAGAPAAEPFANAASRAEDRFTECFNAKDWAGILDCVSARVEFDERRRLSRNRAEREVWLDQLRVMFDLPESRFSKRLLATRGESLCLHLHEFEARVAEDGGPLTMEPHLALHEIDEAGKIVEIVLFDAEDFDGAYAELDRRYEAGEAAAAAETLRAFRQGFAERRWDDLLAVFAPDFVDRDHRSIALLGTRHGGEAWVENVRALVDLAPDAVARQEHLRLARRGLLWQVRWTGTRDGSPFELPMVGVSEFDVDHRIVQIDFYDPERLPQARARFAELSATGGADPFRNAAARADATLMDAFNGRDWPGVEASLAPTFVFDDRRRMRRIAIDRTDFLVQYRFLFEVPESRFAYPLVATRGERLSLHVHRFTGEFPGGGGPLDFEDHYGLCESDASGRLVSMVLFDLEALDAAYAELFARFEAGEGAAHPRALACIRGTARAFADRDWEAYAALAAPGFLQRDRRRLVWASPGRDIRSFLEVMRSLTDAAPDTTVGVDHNRICERGVLYRITQRGTHDGVAFENLLLAVLELDAQGRILSWDTFDGDAQEAAFARFAELHEARSAPPPFRNAATRALERGAAALAARDWERFESLFSPTFRHSDRTKLAQLDANRDTWLTSFRRLVEMTSAPPRYEVLATRGERLVLARMLWEGAGGDVGPSEIEWHLVIEVDERGQHGAVVSFDAADLDAAFAELDARFAAIDRGAPESPFANLATQHIERITAAWAARDWDAIAALRTPGGGIESRRRLVRLTMTREEGLDDLRRLFDARGSRMTMTPVATRGEHLALARLRVEGEVAEGGGLFTTESLALFEVDAESRMAADGVTFDVDDEEAAWAELDARYQASDPGAAAFLSGFMAALEARDWDAVAGLYAPDHVGQDHRLVSWGTLHGPAGFMESLRQMVALAPDVRMRSDQVRASGRGLLMHATWLGTREGGAFESPFVVVTGVDAKGVTRSSDFYDPEQIDRAVARFEEISASVPRAALDPSNPASRLLRRWELAFNARDDEAQLALVAPGFEWDDRQRHVQVRGGVEEMIATTRLRAEAGARATVRIVATAGEHVAIGELRYVGGPADGPFEIELLMVGEADADGRALATVLFDADDRRAALDEAWRRWAAREPGLSETLRMAAAARDGFNARDRERIRHGGVTDDLVVEDHRRTGLGRVESRDVYIDSLIALWDMTAEAEIEVGWHWLALDPNGGLTIVRHHGTLTDGGEFENVYLYLFRHRGGRIHRLEFFELDAAKEALARFEALRSETPLAPGSAPRDLSNSATRSMERWQVSFATGASTDDWTPMRALCGPGFRFEDQRRLALLAGDAELMIASARERAETGARPGLTPIGTAGDRVVIDRVLWSGGPAEGRFEIEYFAVAETDATERLVAILLFDEVRAAQSEAWVRWQTLDPARAAVTKPLGELIDAFEPPDHQKARAALAEDVVLEDHRRTGVGRIEGPMAYSGSVEALFELAPETHVEAGLVWLACEPWGAITVMRRFGVLPEGGPFESEYLFLYTVAGGLITRVEQFEPEDEDAALARFEALRPGADPLAIPPNAAHRAIEQVVRLREAGGLDALESLVSDDFRFEDHGRRSLVQGGVEEWRRALRFLVGEAGARPEARLVATAGDRLALHHVVWRDPADRARFEMESHRIVELDGAGRIRAFLIFDGDDRAGALAALDERLLASAADGVPAAVAALGRALASRNAAEVRACLRDDFVYDDRRRTGAGRIVGADAYLPSAASWVALTRRTRVERLCELAAGPHGRVVLSRLVGENLEGGAFELHWIAVLLVTGGGIAGIELFEPEEREAAIARFAALRPEADPLAIPPNAATRQESRWTRAVLERDWGQVRSLVRPEFVFEDRGRRALVRGNVEAWIASADYTTSLPGVRIDKPILASVGDRLAIDHIRWSGSPGSDGFEFERVRVLEVDAAGLFVAALLFDPEDATAASVEAFARFAAGEAAGSPGVAGLLAFLRALVARDAAAARACFAPGLVFEDHRPLGLGALSGGTFVASIEALDELATDISTEILQVIAWNAKGAVVSVRRRGTVRDGGAFESRFLAVTLGTAERFVRYEVFGEDEVARARARFQELSGEG